MSATNAACNIYSNVTYSVSSWPPWTAEEGDIASFFVKDLGLALAPKMYPDQSQAFKEVNNSQAFAIGRKEWPILFLDEPLPGAPRHVSSKVSRKYSKNWLRTRTSIKSNLTPEIEKTPNPSNYDAKPWFLRFTAQKSKCQRRFWELDPELLHTCWMCPCRAFYGCFFLVFWFFSAENMGFLKTQISQKGTKTQTSGE